MRTITLMILMSMSALMAFAQKAPIETAKGFQIDIKTSAICEMCQYAIEKELTYEKGVKSVNLDLDTKVVTIVYNQKKTSPETLRKRISLTGYHADDIARDPKAYDDLPMCCKDGAHEGE